MKIPLDRCRQLIDSGLSLITVGKDKMPNYTWINCQTKQLTKDQFEKQYNYSGGYIKKSGDEMHATKGVGIVTGYDNLQCFDIDLKVLSSLKEQQDFWKEYIDFLKDNIEDFEDKFVIYKTINNGYHIIFKCAEIGKNTKVATLKGQAQAIIETREAYGYIFIYDKQISKRSYTDIQEISINDRNMLFEVSKYYHFVEEKNQVKIDKKVVNESINIEVKVWDDYNAKVNVWDLISDEFTIVRKLSNKTIIKRNGATSAHSGYIFSDKDCMYLFSTGTIYPNEKLLSPFAIYTYKYHAGDWSASAKKLYKDNYGSRIIREPESISKQIVITPQDLEFPIEIFPSKIQNYLLQCNKTLDSSIDYMGASLIWLISVIIGNSFKIQVKNGWQESVNVWISVVGKAGLGKTPSISNVIFPLNKINNSEIKKYIKQYQKYEAYNNMDKKEKEYTEEIKKPFKTQFIVNDITQEALIEIHEENKNSIGVFKDELAGWFKDMNKYRAGSDLEFWLSSWSNKGISLNRKTAKSSFVESPIIPVLGGIQPSILTQFFTEENKDNGFIDRMLTCFPELQIDSYNENEMPNDILLWYNDYIVTFYEDVKREMIKYNIDYEIDSQITYFGKEAKKEWQRIFNDITKTQNSEDENEYMKSMLPKQKSYVPRFALIIHLFNCYDNKISNVYEISKESILNAEKLSKYFINMAKKIKIDSVIKSDVRKVIVLNKDRSNKDKYIEVLKSNPDFNKKEIAEMLGTSLRTIYRYDNELQQS